jgi:transcriptional regulator with XRE-family HTH domain
LTTLRDQLEPLIRAATIRAVAEKSGVPAPNISDWLRGKSTVTVETAERIATALGVELRAVQSSSIP